MKDGPGRRGLNQYRFSDSIVDGERVGEVPTVIAVDVCRDHVGVHTGSMLMVQICVMRGNSVTNLLVQRPEAGLGRRERLGSAIIDARASFALVLCHLSVASRLGIRATGARALLLRGERRVTCPPP